MNGVADPSLVSPDNWVHDQALLDRPGNDEIQLKLFRDYPTNVDLYPQVHQYFRDSQVPLLAVWGANDEIFGPDGARAFAQDLPAPRSTCLNPGTSPWRATSRPSPSTSAASSPASSTDAPGAGRLRPTTPLPPQPATESQSPCHVVCVAGGTEVNGPSPRILDTAYATGVRGRELHARSAGPHHRTTSRRGAGRAPGSRNRKGHGGRLTPAGPPPDAGVPTAPGSATAWTASFETSALQNTARPSAQICSTQMCGSPSWPQPESSPCGRRGTVGKLHARTASMSSGTRTAAQPPAPVRRDLR